jgi:hypothetical protein
MKTILLASLCVFAGACAADSATSLDPAPPAGGQQLATDTYRLQPGEEKYMCYQFYSPDEKVAITKVDTLSMPGIHHMVVFQALGEKEDDAPHECAQLIKETWLPIAGNGTGSQELVMPANVGFIIDAHTQYIVQLHLQNSSDQALDIRAGVNFAYDHAPANITPAGMFALGSFTVNIPPQTVDYQIPVQNCMPSRDMNVFAVMPHMHKLGTQLAVKRNAGDFYKIDPWVFGNQPMDPLIQKISPTDTFDMTCHYTNHTDQTVTYGESSNDEMCFFVMFYYPYTGLAGCINS